MNMFRSFCIITLLSFVYFGCTSTQKVVVTEGHSNVEIPDSLYPSVNLQIEGHTPYTQKHYPERIAYFKKNPLQLKDVVFLGNSITEMGADWGKRLEKPGIKNRGIGGDISAGVLLRLGEITFVKPSAVFLLIGINDINHTKLSAFQIASNIVEITKIIKCESPKTKVFVQTIFPSSAGNIKAKIAETNLWIKRKHQRKLFTIIDTHVLLRDENDLIKKEYTYDGIHLTETGYTAWVNKLKGYFADIKPGTDR